MNRNRFRTVVIGFGKIGAGYADDPVMARYFPYATHAQTLAIHPGFAWEAVVDVSDEALKLAQERWQVPYTAKTVEEVIRQYQPEVAVIATPPESRLEILKKLPTVRGILVEKPLGRTVAEGQEFMDYCQQQGILIQVNLWRRADETLQSLSGGRLFNLVGRPQAVFGLYGNGLLNNGTHMVDFVRMLLGEIEAVHAIPEASIYPAGPISGDMNVSFNMRLSGGVVVSMHPIQFEHYRENSLDIWGERGRLSIMQEGLGIFLYPCVANRAMQGEREIASDQPRIIESTVGHAFYHIYSNLADALNRGSSLWSDGGSALRTAEVVEAVMSSWHNKGRWVELH